MSQDAAALAPISRKGSVDLNQLLRGILQSRDCLPRTRRIWLKADLAENLPRVWGDPIQIGRVLLGMIVNAEQATAEEIHVKTGVEHGRVHVSVTDNGRGIHSRDMALLFNDENTDAELTGCAGIVRDHGGELYAWSSYGKGSVFTLELPIQRFEAPEQPALNGKRILVIDDEVQISRLMSEVLETHGAKIDLVNSGLQAAEQIQAKEYDLFICDQHMPDLSGERLYWSVKSANPKLENRFLFVTGDVMNAETAHFFSNTGVRYIRKPFRSVELLSAVEQMLSRNQQRSF